MAMLHTLLCGRLNEITARAGAGDGYQDQDAIIATTTSGSMSFIIASHAATDEKILIRLDGLS